MKTPPAPVEYLLPDGLDPEAVVAQLAAARGVEDRGVSVCERTLLDTFDWRLYRAGTRAEALTGGAGPAFRWLRRGDGEVVRQLPGPAPRLAADLPAGAARRALEAVIEMRALLPQARLRSRVRELAVRDPRQKVVARLRVEQHTLLGDAAGALSGRLALEPVKGYERAAMKLRRRLLAPLGLATADRDLLDEALERQGITPAAYSSKVRVALQPEMPAGDAARVILLHLLEAMERNEAGTVADLDPEFLHDFRVAVRRTRAALGQLKGVLPAAPRERFQGEFAWLGTITSPTRDLDVYRLNFPTYQASLPRDRRADLDPLQAFLRDHQREEQAVLAGHLRGRRYRRLKRDWRAFLETAGAPCPPGADAPARAVARQRIWKVYRRILRDGAVLDGACPAEPFHELRKTCKKLRYLLEFFQSLFPEAEVAGLVKSLKIIQDNLGVHNDLEVQALALTGFGQRMQAGGGTPAACLMAMGMLVEDLGRRQAAARDEFAELFGRFSARATRRRFRKLFAPPARGRGKGCGR